MLVYVVGVKHEADMYMYPIKAVRTLEEAKEACITHFKRECLAGFSIATYDVGCKVSFNMIDKWLIMLESKSLSYNKEYVVRALDIE